MPIGFCTGRQLESFERNGLNEIVEKMDLDKKDKFLENLYLFGENGALGYDFNPQTQKFEEFYTPKNHRLYQVRLMIVKCIMQHKRIIKKIPLL